MYPRGQQYRYYQKATHSSHVVRIPTANVYRFGETNNARPLLHSVDWTVREGESWAVVGSGAGEKTALLEVGHLNRRSVHSSPFLLLYLRAICRPFSETCGYLLLPRVGPSHLSRSSRVP
jgi:hypothetical protein